MPNPSPPQLQPKVILIHGLHMHAPVMRPLAKRLMQHGFDCHIFGYYSMLHSIERHSQRLHEYLVKNFSQTDTFHLVGHSLGGLVIRDFLTRYPDWVNHGKIERIVTLGTPHISSQMAERILKILPSLVGKSYIGGLDGKASALVDGIELGVIAGNRPVSLGRMLASREFLAQDNDGTVLVSETRLPNATDHITLPYGHTELIFSEEVANQVVYFLQFGEFQR